MTFRPPSAILLPTSRRGIPRRGLLQRSPRVIDLSAPPAPLSPHWAFVVQFRTEADVAAGLVVGRVEHVVSGQATTFQTLESLLAFIAPVLAEGRAGPPEAGEADRDNLQVKRHDRL